MKHVSVEVDYTKFGQTRRVQGTIYNPDSSYEWDADLWVERDEDMYALGSPDYRGKRVLVVRRAKWLRGTIIATILAALLLMACSDPSPASSSSRSTSACNMSRSFVKDKLKAPATAAWQDCKIFADPDRPDRYTVQSSVDSQNSFGATIRTKYMAILDRDPKDGGWILVNLVHTP